MRIARKWPTLATLDGLVRAARRESRARRPESSPSGYVP